MVKKKLEPFTIEKATFDLERIEFNDILKDSKPIIFDTNFLFVTFAFKIDVIEEIKRVVGPNFTLYIYDGTIEELKSVEKQKDKNKAFLPLIVKMLHIYGFKVIKSDVSYIDEQILSNLHKNVLIATNDKELRELIHAQQFRVLFLRQKSYLQVK